MQIQSKLLLLLVFIVPCCCTGRDTYGDEQEHAFGAIQIYDSDARAILVIDLESLEPPNSGNSAPRRHRYQGTVFIVVSSDGLVRKTFIEGPSANTNITQLKQIGHSVWSIHQTEEKLWSVNVDSQDIQINEVNSSRFKSQNDFKDFYRVTSESLDDELVLAADDYFGYGGIAGRQISLKKSSVGFQFKVAVGGLGYSEVKISSKEKPQLLSLRVEEVAQMMQNQD